MDAAVIYLDIPDPCRMHTHAVGLVLLAGIRIDIACLPVFLCILMGDDRFKLSLILLVSLRLFLPWFFFIGLRLRSSLLHRFMNRLLRFLLLVFLLSSQEEIAAEPIPLRLLKLLLDRFYGLARLCIFLELGELFMDVIELADRHIPLS